MDQSQLELSFDQLNDLDQFDEAQEANQTPSTVTTALPTPHEYLTGPDQAPWPPPRIYTPAAPLLRDLDSFTDGTGSFDCLSEITAPGELCAHPLTTLHERNVSQLDAEDHMQSIAIWREDVHLELDVDVVHDPCTQPTPVRYAIIDNKAPPICKRPRSVASSDDGRKRIRVQGASTTLPTKALQLDLAPPPRRPRTVSAPPRYVEGSTALS